MEIISISFSIKEIQIARSCREQLESGFVDIPTIKKILGRVDVNSAPPAPGKRRSTAAERDAKYTAKFKLKHPEFYK